MNHSGKHTDTYNLDLARCNQYNNHMPRLNLKESNIGSGEALSCYIEKLVYS